MLIIFCVYSCSPPPAIRKHDARSRHSPERIHRKPVHVAKAVRSTAAAPDSSSVSKVQLLPGPRLILLHSLSIC